MLNNVPAITVFTPTFNRAHTLPRLYQSLQEQTFRNFEWLIVDDGSSDGTKELVAGWIEEGLLSIRYFHQTNRGKHIAFNRGVAEASAPLFASVDSDDTTVPTSLATYYREWTTLLQGNADEYSGVSGLCNDDRGNLIGTPYPQSPMISDLSEIRYKWRVKGDKLGCYNISVLKQHPFPDLQGARFIPEGIVWSQIARNYKHRFVNEVIARVYIHETAGNQLTKIADPRIHAHGHAYWHRQRLNTETRWLRYAPVEFLRSAVHYVRFSLHDRVGLLRQFRQLTSTVGRALWCVALAVGYTIFWRDRRRLKQATRKQVAT